MLFWLAYTVIGFAVFCILSPKRDTLLKQKGMTPLKVYAFLLALASGPVLWAIWVYQLIIFRNIGF